MTEQGGYSRFTPFPPNEELLGWAILTLGLPLGWWRLSNMQCGLTVPCPVLLSLFFPFFLFYVLPLIRLSHAWLHLGVCFFLGKPPKHSLWLWIRKGFFSFTTWSVLQCESNIFVFGITDCIMIRLGYNSMEFGILTLNSDWVLKC